MDVPSDMQKAGTPRHLRNVIQAATVRVALPRGSARQTNITVHQQTHKAPLNAETLWSRLPISSFSILPSNQRFQVLKSINLFQRGSLQIEITIQ